MSTYVGDSSLELDLKGHIARVIDLLAEAECDALTLLIV